MWGGWSPPCLSIIIGSPLLHLKTSLIPPTHTHLSAHPPPAQKNSPTLWTMFHFSTGHIFDSLMAPPKRKEHAQGRYRESSPDSTPFCWLSSHNETIWDSKFCSRRDERSTLAPFPYELVLYSTLKSMQLSQAAAQNTRAVYIKRIALSIVQQ